MKQLLFLTYLVLFSVTINAQGWGQVQKIVAGDRHVEQEFGCAVSIQGNIAAIGARSDNESVSDGGAVYIYEKDASDNWVFTQKLANSDPRQFDRFGQSVAIDGNYMIVGAKGQDYDENNVNFENGAGAAYIFEKDNSGTWNQIQKLVASDRGASFQPIFGETVAISGDYIVVNAPTEDTGLEGDPEVNAAGASYIFERDDNGVWQEVQKIVSSDRDIGERWGDLAIDILGDIIVVGSYLESLDASGENEVIHAGACYIFERDTNGTWNEIQKIVASDREQSEIFGRSVAIDGDFIIVGAPQEYLQGSKGAEYGAVYAGNSIDIYQDRLIVGANLMPIGPTVGGGAAFVFENDGTNVWSQTAIMYDQQVNSNDRFGEAVAIHGDFAMVGALKEDEDENGVNTISQAGSVYVFDFKEPNTLEPLNTLSLINTSLSSGVKAYPNPTENILNIDLGNFQDKVTITLTNMLGQQVLIKNYTNIETVQLDFQEKTKGMYVLEVNNGERLQSVIKIVKQ